MELEMKGYIRTKENRRKISLSLKKYFSNPEVKEKLSIQNSGKNNPRFGKPLSLKMRKKLHEKYLGDKNHQFKHGKYMGKHDYRKIRKDLINYDYKFNNKFKSFIRNRDNQVCMLCRTHREKLKLPLHVHHINYDSHLTIKENCLSLCASCHTQTKINQEEWINFFHSLLTKKYGYVYENGDVKIELKKEIK